jgi:hypothetical protein
MKISQIMLRESATVKISMAELAHLDAAMRLHVESITMEDDDGHLAKYRREAEILSDDMNALMWSIQGQDPSELKDE